MGELYLIPLIPIIIGAVCYYFNDKVHIYEWLIGSAVAFITATIIHSISFYSQTSDIEVWSGKVEYARQYSAWREQYEEAVYKTDDDGDRVFSHYETERRWHDEYFVIHTNLNTTHHVSEAKYQYFVKKFNNITKVEGDRTTSETDSHMIDGDPYDYISYAKNNIEPIHENRKFQNKLKAARSVFEFAKIPDGMKVEPYPISRDIFKSKRVLGTARKRIDIKEWDSMNAILGPIKKVNVIIVGFSGPDSMQAEWLRANWKGGKKNDIVICYGNGWSKVFGWSDAELCKVNLQSIALRGPVDETIIPKIKDEIMKNYKETDWTRFDHLQISPKTSHYVWLFVVLIVTQGGLYFYFHQNEYTR